MMPNKTTILLVSIVCLLAACSSSSTSAEPTLDPGAAQGKLVFKQNCASCHATQKDAIIVGPSLYGVASRAENNDHGLDARGFLEESILTPGAVVTEGYKDLMPDNFGKVLPSEDFDALIAYLLTLK